MKSSEITLNGEQEEAIDKVFDFASKPGFGEFLFEGPAGSGKTLCATRVASAISERGESVAVCAPTNKAARVLRDGLDGAEVGTIHSYLGLTLKRSGFEQELSDSGFCTRKAKLMLIDEASMLSVQLKKHIHEYAKKHGVRVVYLGDSCQLPPVVKGMGMRFIQSWVFKEVKEGLSLTKVMRHSGSVLDFAIAVRKIMIEGGPLNWTPSGDVMSLAGADFDEALKESLSRDSVTRVLAWRNATVKIHNSFARKFLYGDIAETQPFIPGEPVVACEPVLSLAKKGNYGNKYREIYMHTDDETVVQSAIPKTNPDNQGILCTEVSMRSPLTGKLFKAMIPTDRGERALKTSLQSLKYSKRWKEYWNLKDKYSDIRPCHALTVHRSQGSTFDEVFVDLDDLSCCPTPELQLRLLYTAATRASTRLYLRTETR